MIALLFLLLLIAAVLFHYLQLWVLWLYLGLSVATFALYVRDKSAARQRRARTPETTLHLLALCGGWPGARLAQQLVHHKSSKASFQLSFWLTAGLNVAGLLYLLSPPGQSLAATLQRLVP